MRKDLATMSNKCRFITSVNNGTIILRDRTKQQILTQLEELKFESRAKSDDDGESSGKMNFDYLLSMPLYSLTKEKIEELQKKISQKQEQIKTLEAMTEADIWL